MHTPTFFHVYARKQLYVFVYTYNNVDRFFKYYLHSRFCIEKKLSFHHQTGLVQSSSSITKVQETKI